MLRPEGVGVKGARRLAGGPGPEPEDGCRGARVVGVDVGGWVVMCRVVHDTSHPWTDPDPYLRVLSAKMANPDPWKDPSNRYPYPQITDPGTRRLTS